METETNTLAETTPTDATPKRPRRVPSGRKRTPNPDATESREEALLLLHEKRGDMIKAGREIAHELCKKNGEVTSRDVIHEMRRRGMLQGYEGTDHWLGAIFSNNQFRRLPGRMSFAVSKETNIHKRALPVWAAWPEGMRHAERKRINKSAPETLTNVYALAKAFVDMCEAGGERDAKKAAYEALKAAL